MKLIVSVVFGALVAVSGTFLHNSYRPIGLLISLLALHLGLRLVRNMFLSRLANFLFALGWLLIVVRASSIGNGGEVLIQANLYGNVFVFGGVGLIAVFLLRQKK